MDVMDIVLNVPVRRFVLKYIRSKFSLKEGEPWRIGTRGKECVLFYSLLERTPDRYERYKKSEAILQICIPTKVYLRRGNFLSQDGVEMFTNFVRDVLIDEITMYYFGVKNGVGLKKCDKVVATVFKSADESRQRNSRIPTGNGTRFFAQNETIYDILKKYDIGEQDLTFDSVIKHLQRTPMQNKRLKISA